jgi:hypothetical protein
MGKWKENSTYPRNIVAIFTYFKDREYIHTHATKYLHRTNVCFVNEQRDISQKWRKGGKSYLQYCVKPEKTAGVTKYFEPG